MSYWNEDNLLRFGDNLWIIIALRGHFFRAILLSRGLQACGYHERLPNRFKGLER